MSLEKNNNCFISCGVLFILAIIFGVITASVWLFGFAPYTRLMVQFAAGFGFLIVLITGIIVFFVKKHSN